MAYPAEYVKTIVKLCAQPHLYYCISLVPLFETYSNGPAKWARVKSLKIPSWRVLLSEYKRTFLELTVTNTLHYNMSPQPVNLWTVMSCCGGQWFVLGGCLYDVNYSLMSWLQIQFFILYCCLKESLSEAHITPPFFFCAVWVSSLLMPLKVRWKFSYVVFLIQKISLAATCERVCCNTIHLGVDKISSAGTADN